MSSEKQEPPIPQNPSDDKGYSIWWIIGGVIVALIVIILLIIFFRRRSSENSVEKSDQILSDLSNPDMSLPVSGSENEALLNTDLTPILDTDLGARLSAALGASIVNELDNLNNMTHSVNNTPIRKQEVHNNFSNSNYDINTTTRHGQNSHVSNLSSGDNFVDNSAIPMDSYYSSVDMNW